MTDITTGSVLTCSNPDCGCELEVRRPCPHGDDYRCACGHPLVASPHRQTLAERVEELGIVDQQTVLVDDVEAEREAR